MMNEEEGDSNNDKNKDVMFLLAKRRKLLSMRIALTSRRAIGNEGNDIMMLDNPDTPLSSTTETSITPPPFSPLTPQVYVKSYQENQERSNIDSPLIHVHRTTSPTGIKLNQCNPDSLSPVTIVDTTAINYSTEPNSSPLPSMSPETQKLFDVLAEPEILENNSPDFIENSDDSAADPNFEICDIEESDTECGSDDNEEDNNINKYIKNNNDTENEHIESLITIGEESSETKMHNSSSITQDEDETKKSSEKNMSGKGGEILTPAIQVQEIGNLSPEGGIGQSKEANTIENNDQIVSTSNLKIGRPKKGRKRKYSQSNSERKFNKYNNLPYTTVHKHKNIEPKIFKDHQCKCLKKCASLISMEERKKEFETFVTLGSYNAQLMYIMSCVKEEGKKRSYTMTGVPDKKKKPKQFNRTYTLSGVKVCRDMFLNTLQISTQKVTIALNKIRNNNINDGRGKKQGGWNKLTEQNLNFIIEVISNLPKYTSHYRREHNNESLYLQPGMTIAKIYEIYKKMYTEKFGTETDCASFETVKRIFLTKFNLKCKPLKKDTCNKCDLFAVQLQNTKSESEKIKIESDKSSHLEKALKMREQMNCDFETAQNTPNIECLSFDLEKTLPLPRIPTNVIFYKRQLWVYNSGIHSASDDTGHCYVWVEGEAGRGAQEVGSCLIKYIETKLPTTIEHLILWSDCCGGQNRNIKIVLMLKAILNSHLTLKTICFRYLESGHSFLPNDTDFSKIETALKNQQRIYTADEYIQIMKGAKKQKPFQVYKMEKNDFYGTITIEKNIVNRKKFIDKSKVNWLQAKEIKIKKSKLYSIFMRTSLDDDFMEINIKKTKRGEILPIDKSDLKQLWPNGKPIAPAKLADLQSIYKFIPADCLGFYEKLKASEDVIDDVDAFGGELDFVLDDEP